MFRTKIEEYESGTFPSVSLNFVKSACKHCLKPACVSACTVGALQKTADGPVVYDSQKCIGCRYCMYACPFGVPKFEWHNQLALISKCDFCVNRADGGEGPACAQACPFGAITYGERDDLLAEAHARIQAHPDRYVNHVYGEREGGGLSILYLASEPFENPLGFPQLGDTSPAYANEEVMHATPTVAVGMALALSGIYWTVKRRNEVKNRLAPVTLEPDKEA
jgi:formate dehydrogenase iron-sulfur subunit